MKAIIIPVLLLAAIIQALATHASAASCDKENGKFFCLGYEHGVAAADRGDSNDCPNDDHSNPNNAVYCDGFTTGYKDEANAK
jgi:hypothetical protein